MYYPYAGGDMPWEFELCAQNGIPMQVWRKVTSEAVPNVQPHYWISNYGNVWSEVLWDFMLPSQRVQDGYLEAHLSLINGESITIGIHRLEMLVFNYIPNYKDMVVNHIDGIKFHNWLWNLEWVTQQENIMHAYEIGLKPRGCDAHNSKFTEEEIRSICKMLEDGYTYNQIVDALGIKGRTRNTNYTISDIRNGRAYTSISKDYDFSNAYSRSDVVLFTDEEVEKICKILSEKPTSYLDILTQLGYNINDLDDKELEAYKKAVSRIKIGIGHTNIASNYEIKEGRSDRKLTDDQVHMICQELVKGTSTEDIVNMIFDTSKMGPNEIYNMKNVIIRIRRGICYKHISSQYNLCDAPPAKRSNYHFDDVQENEIIKLIEENPYMNNKQILEHIMDTSNIANADKKKLTDAISYIRRKKMNNKSKPIDI